MTPDRWIQLLAIVVEAIPELASALARIVRGDSSPEARRVREILTETSESERAAAELRRGGG